MSVVLTEVRGAIGIATLNRPEALNALNTPLLDALAATLEACDTDPAVRVMIVTGSAKAFAAGADIKEMAPKSFAEMHRENIFGRQFDRIARIRKPIIAAVSGFALGGGCELALALDLILAADSAKFGQPEITLGIIPGLGGSQRLARAVGKAKAMELCLTGRMMDEAHHDPIFHPHLVDEVQLVGAFLQQLQADLARHRRLLADGRRLGRGPLVTLVRTRVERIENFLQPVGLEISVDLLEIGLDPRFGDFIRA